MPLKTLSSKSSGTARRLSWLSRELFQRNMTRFWPLWALYAAIWVIALPVIQAAQLFGPVAKHLSKGELAARATAELLQMSAEFNLVVCAIFGVVFAMALFSYLCFSRSVGLFHSFPVRREGLFATNYLSGVAVFVGVNLLVMLLTAAVQGAGGVLIWGNLLQWFVCVTGELLFFYSFAVFCAMFTGQILAIPVFYVILNFLAVVVNLLVQDFAGVFLYGYSGGGTPLWVRWLTPIWQLMRSVQVDSVWDEKLGRDVAHTLTGVGTIGIYALAGLVFAGFALLVYRRRKSETAGDTVAVFWAKPIFRYGVGVCCALSLGLGLYVMIWDQLRDGVGYSLVGALLCMALAGAIGYFVAEMLLQKSFRVWKKAWKGVVVLLAAIAVFGICLSLDATGVERRIPSTDRVESLEVSFGGQGWCEATLRDAELIDQFREVHQALIDEKKQTLQRQEETSFSEESPYEYGYVDFSYHLKSGSTVRRSYTLYYTPEQLQDGDTAVAKVAALASNPAVQRSNLLDDYQNIQRLTGGEMTYVNYSEETDYQDKDMSFDAQTAQALFHAVEQDIAAGHFGRNTFDALSWERETYINTLFLYGLSSNGTGTSNLTIEFSSNATNLIAALKQNGIVDENHPLVTQAEANASDRIIPQDTVTAEEVPADVAQSSPSVSVIGGADGATEIFVN